MKTVWKFPIRIAADQIVLMPFGAKILHVGLDPSSQPCLWANVTSSNVPVERSVHISGTGHPIPDGDNRHVGSFVDGSFVWHVWEPA
jgi:hypothetical protein